MSNPGQAPSRTTIWQRLLQWLTYSYLIRFPILTALSLALLPYAAFRTSARALLETLFDLTPLGISLVTLTALLAAWSVMSTARLALIYSGERFEAAPVSIGYQLKWKHILLFGLLATPMLIGVLVEAAKLWHYPPPHQTAAYNYWKLAALALGVVLALLLLWLADLLQRRLNRLRPNRPAPDLLMPSDSALTGELLPPAAAVELAKPQPSKLAKLMKRVPAYLGRGYVDYDAGPEDPFPLLPGHGMALALMLTFLAVYGVVGFLTSPWLSSLRAPSLAGVLLLLTMLNWFLSGGAFFFDRYRIPVLVTLLLLLGVTSWVFRRSDSYYFIFPKPAAEVAAGQSVLASRPDAKVILVAANGGGIQAAAWTARVLTGIEAACRQSGGCGPRRFARSVRLVSAVSGGSVGAMYFVNAYQEDGQLPAELEPIVDVAARSSLDGLAWGLVYPDFLRTLAPFLSEVPFFWYTDRARTLEFEWQRGVPGLRQQRLSGWRKAAAQGQRPGVVFNATVVDNGVPLLFSTITHDRQLSIARTFEQLYGAYDVPVTSAVRLSATFPYVTPAARAHRIGEADYSTPTYHVVDGGYYDNYGMATLVEWLNDELEHGEIKEAEVLVIRILSMPVGVGQSPDDSRGFFYQSFVPVTTLNNVRGAGQLSHSQVEFDLLQKRWRERGDQRVNIELATFAFPADTAPLSWHLTEMQKQAIKQAWQTGFVQKPDSELNHVMQFLTR
jgi:hypothetical protein